MVPIAETGNTDTHAEQVYSEQVFFNIHHRVSILYLRHTSSKLRSFLELFWMLLAVSGFAALICLHLAFVYRGNPTVYSLRNITHHTLRSIPSTCLPSVPGFRADANVTHLVLLEDANEKSFAWVLSSPESRQGQHNGKVCSATDDDVCRSQMQVFPASLQGQVHFSFSQTKGYALLTPDLLDLRATAHGVPTQIVAISKTDASCFGEPFLQETVFRLLGPDLVMINWLLAISNGTGFIYNPRTDDKIVDLSGYAILNVRNSGLKFSAATLWDAAEWSKWSRPWTSKFRTAVKTCLIYFISTNLVSFLLRVAQERLLKLSLQIRSHQQWNRPIIPLFVSHVADCFIFIPITVGVLFYLREFYQQDWVIALAVLGVVFICELFSFFSVRTVQGIFFFPRAFFLLFCLVHFYLFSFPFGFAHVAMGMIVCFMLQCVTFFWNRYEVPAVALGRVSVDHRSRGDYSSHAGSMAVAVHRGDVLGERNELNRSARRADSPARRNTEPILRVSLQPQYQQQPIHHTYSQSTFSQGRMSRGSSEAIFQRSGDADDESESESCLYFLGGEVVIRRGDDHRLNNSSNSGGSASNSNQMNRQDSSSTLQSSVVQLGIIADETTTRDLTPRLCNLSRAGVTIENTSSVAPCFPLLDSSRRGVRPRCPDNE